MAYSLERFAATGETAYVSKHNANAAAIEAALNALVTQIGAAASGSAASLPAVLRALFGEVPAVIGEASYKPTISGLTLHVAPGFAWLPAGGVVASAAAEQTVDLTASADGTHYLTADALGVAAVADTSQDALYSVVKSGGALSALTRLAAVSWGQGDWAAAQQSAANGEFLALDDRLEAIEVAVADVPPPPDLSGYQATSEKGEADGYASLDGTGKIPAAQMPASPWDIALAPYPGKPANSALMLRMAMARAVTFVATLAPSRASAAIAATASTVFSIQKNGVEFGTVTFAAGGAAGTFASAAGATFAAGDVLSIVAPASADATLADISITLAGTR